MDVENKRYKKHIRQRTAFRLVLICTLVLALAVIGFVFYSLLSPAVMKSGTGKVNSKNSQTSSTVSEPEFIDTYATVLSTGDIMVHEPQLTGAYNSSTGEYDFSDFFKAAAPYFQAADLSVANLEVTFGGNDGRKYSGYPSFNCPDSLAQAIKDSGLNLLLTANNHSYDTGLSGFMRTQQVLKDLGIEYIGTRPDTETDNYIIKDINNIKIGIADFTYETDGDKAGRKYLNGILLAEEANGLINSFSYKRIDEFYTQAENIITAMKAEGAEYILFYMHWGNEYWTEASDWQKQIAQRLSNLGVDMIIGGHPHVVEPMELITSEDGTHKTVCIYSLGNAVSNQRQERMDSCPTGHTEDGMLFTFTLKKTKDGVSLHDLDIIPTWVDKYWVDGGYKYTIYPLEYENAASEKYNLSESISARAAKSYNRTVEIVAEGLTVCQKEIGCQITFE